MVDTEPTGAESIERRSDIYRDAQSVYSYWRSAIDLAGKTEEDWQKSADLATKIYRADKTARRAFNILFSNVQTIVPALYNSSPVPDVRPRQRKKEDAAPPPQPKAGPPGMGHNGGPPMGAAAPPGMNGAGPAGYGGNGAAAPPQMPGMPPMPQMPEPMSEDEAIRLAGQVIELSLAYQLDEYDFDDVATSCVRDMQIAGRGVARVRWKTMSRQDKETGERVVWEEARCEHVNWRDFRRGPGSIWAEVPWVAYRQYMTRDELVKLMVPPDGTPEEKAKAYQQAQEIPLDTMAEGYDTAGKTEREQEVWKRACVWEIWDKDSRSIIFISPGYNKGPLFMEKDPYGLLGFFDCAKPLQAISDPDTMVPVTPYEVYKDQAEELAAISQRILVLVGLIKLCGFYAGEIPELSDLEKLRDGQFQSSPSAFALLGGKQALTDAIWTMPIENIVITVRELVAQREQIKQVIYEVYGISDILRGATNASETLGAQQIKAQWGSLRVNDQQRNVSRFCRDIFRIKGEVIANKFSKRTLEQIVGEKLPDEVMKILRSDARRCYLIDVETDSTIRGDLVRAQENMSNFMNASAQFFQTFVPLIESKMLPPMVAQAAVAIYLAFAKTYKLGKQAEDVLAKLEKAAASAPIGQPTPEEEAEEQEIKQLEKQGAAAKIREVEAKAYKTEREAEIVAPKPVPIEFPQPTPPPEVPEVPPHIQAARELAKTAKTIAETDKTVAEVDAQRLESAIVSTQGSAGPGFVQ